jgi:hypothetical protein
MFSQRRFTWISHQCAFAGHLPFASTANIKQICEAKVFLRQLRFKEADRLVACELRFRTIA